MIRKAYVGIDRGRRLEYSLVYKFRICGQADTRFSNLLQRPQSIGGIYGFSDTFGSRNLREDGRQNSRLPFGDDWRAFQIYFNEFHVRLLPGTNANKTKSFDSRPNVTCLSQCKFRWIVMSESAIYEQTTRSRNIDKHWSEERWSRTCGTSCLPDSAFVGVVAFASVRSK